MIKLLSENETEEAFVFSALICEGQAKLDLIQIKMVFVARRRKKRNSIKNGDGQKKVIGSDRENKIMSKASDRFQQILVKSLSFLQNFDNLGRFWTFFANFCQNIDNFGFLKQILG